MEQTIVDSVQLGGSVDTDLSIIGLFLAADPVVKAVMLGLIIVSIFTWAIICLLYTSPSPRDRTRSRMPSSA